MAAGDYIIPGAQAISQWGIGFVNACGEAALSVVQAIQNGAAPTLAGLVNLVKQGPSFGTAVSGTSTPSELTALASANGVPLARGSGAGALATINANLAQGTPTILEVQHAQAFGGSDRNVSGHYVTVVGQAANGNYIVADSNQSAATSGGFVQYTAQQITNAQPFATLTPTKSPNPGTALGGFTSAAISQGLQGAFGGIGASLSKSLGVTGINDFVWRSVLIIGGLALIVLGLMVFFSHQENEFVSQYSQAVTGAVKGAATAAAGAE